MGQGGEERMHQGWSVGVCLLMQSLRERERERERERWRQRESGEGNSSRPCLHNAHAVLQVKSG